LYGTFLFTADDTVENVSGLFQFSNGKNKRGVYLGKGSLLQFDGQSLQGDSISIAEVYYETSIPYDHFSADHILTLKTETGKSFKEEIDFKPVLLATEIAEEIDRSDLAFSIKGVYEYDKVQLALVDTAFNTNDVHIDNTLQGETLLVAKNRLKNISNGPLIIYLMIEKRMPLHSGLNDEIIVRYTFRRETELVD